MRLIPKKETYETSLTRLTIFQDRTFDTLPSLAKEVFSLRFAAVTFSLHFLLPSVCSTLFPSDWTVVRAPRHFSFYF